MRLIGIMYLLSCCECLVANVDAPPTNVTPELSTLMRNIISASRNRSNNTNFNSDVFLSTPEMIRRAGYPTESHVIMTEDGYLLTLHRIPGGNDSLPVLLQHGILCSSADWVVLGKGKAFAFLLADQGYDVWLGNYRGNIYSKAHISLSPSDSTFWNFSFHEMGIYDLPAMITFITNMRSQPLYTYIGYSMGVAGFYVMASERPEIARMVQMMISFAPVVLVNHAKSPIRYLVPFSKEIETIMRFFFHGEFLNSDFLRLLGKYHHNLIEVIFVLCGYDREQFDYDLVPIIFNNFPASSSAKTFLHYFQGFQSGKFRQYDYGHTQNLLIYNSTEPPDYDLANIMIPIALFYSDNDLLASIEDVIRLYHSLPHVVDMYKVPWSGFNHVDFLWAKDAPKFVYERALRIMKEIKI